MKPSTISRICVATIQGWWADRAMSMGASLAFYTVFSLAPILLMAIAVAGFFFGNDEARQAVVRETSELVGDSAAAAIDSLLATGGKFGSGLLGTIVGVLTFLISATAAFIELQDDLNIILKAQPPKYASYLLFLRQRFISFAMIVAIGFLLLVSLTLDAALTAARSYFNLGAVGVIISIVNVALSLGMSVTLFVLIFKILPNVQLPWKNAIAGAVVTGIMFVVGKFLIGFYLGRAEVASNFGAAASIITILLWIYYSSQILLLGAEFVKASISVGNSRAS